MRTEGLARTVARQIIYLSIQACGIEKGQRLSTGKSPAECCASEVSARTRGEEQSDGWPEGLTAWLVIHTMHPGLSEAPKIVGEMGLNNERHKH